MHKKCYALILSILVLSAISMAHVAVATVSEPIVEAHGTLYKTIMAPPVGYWNYIDDLDVASVLENYDTIPEQNVTVNTFDLVFTDGIANRTVKDTDIFTGGNSGDKWGAPSVGLYTDSMDLDYILFSSMNTTVLGGGENGFSWCMVPAEQNVKSDQYWAVIVKYYESSSQLSTVGMYLFAEFIDEGGEDHMVNYRFPSSGSSAQGATDIDGDGKDDDWYQQFPNTNMKTTAPISLKHHKISYFEGKLGVSFSKLNATGFGAYYMCSGGAEAEIGVKYKIRTQTIFDKKMELENVLINSTATQSITFEAESSWDCLIPIEVAGNVSIPFVHTPVPTYIYHDSDLAVEYEHEVLLPDESELLYDSCKINYTVGDGTPSKLTVNAVDYFSKIKLKDPADEIELLSSISAGELKEVETYVTYTTDEYYELAMQVPVAWYTPRGIADKFLGFFVAILNVLGFSGATMKKMRARVRTPAKR